MAERTWLQRVKRILEQVQASDATEVEMREGAFRLRVRRSAQPHPFPAESGRQAVPSEALYAIVAPLGGVFYEGPSPDSAPYVRAGDWVDPTEVVGLIEAMKVFTEVTADRAGRVVRVVAESGQMVSAGDALMMIDVRGSADRWVGL